MQGIDISYAWDGTAEEDRAFHKLQPSSESPWGPSKQRKWLELLVLAAVDVVELTRELAMVKEAVAEVLVPPYQGRHQK